MITPTNANHVQQHVHHALVQIHAILAKLDIIYLMDNVSAHVQKEHMQMMLTKNAKHAQQDAHHAQMQIHAVLAQMDII